MTNPPRQLTHIRSAIESRPWAITEGGLNELIAIVENHVAGGAIEIAATDTYLEFIRAAVAAAMRPGDMLQGEESPYSRVGTLAIVPLVGPLFAKANLMTRRSGATSYEKFTEACRLAVADESVDRIGVVSNSPGGEAAGVMDAADALYDLRDSGKAIIGLVDPQCASAAYAILSQCEDIYSLRSGLVGSIGVIMELRSATRAEQNIGIERRVFRTSELKGTGVGPMTAGQEESIRRLMMDLDRQFVAVVERGRPGMDVEQVRNEQEIWTGEQAVDVGMVDGISTLPEIIDQYR